MTKNEVEKVDKVITELDTAVGMMTVAAMKDPVLRQAMEKVINASFELTKML